jgi:hypothetical protein
MSVKSNFLIQGALLVCLIILGVAVFNLSSQNQRLQEHLDSKAQTGSDKAKASLQADSQEQIIAAIEAQSSTQTQLARVTKRLEGLEAQLASLRNQTWANDSEQGDAVASSAGEPALQVEEVEDLSSRFANEAETSSWGETAAAAVNESIVNDYPSSYLFTQYGGDVNVKCKQTICKVAWSPGSQVSDMSESDRLDIIQRAKYELLALAGHTNAGGQVSVTADLESESPAVTLMIEHAPESAAPELPPFVKQRLGQ